MFLSAYFAYNPLTIFVTLLINETNNIYYFHILNYKMY